MASTIYLPIATPEARSLARSWNDGRTKKGKTPYAVIACADEGFSKQWRRNVAGTRVLAGVGAGDKLYILSHGAAVASGLNQPAAEIGMDRGAQQKSLWPPVWEGGTWRGYTPYSLAAHLAAEGLTFQIADVRLFACGTGVQTPTLSPFAKQFKDELVKRGYMQVTVTGYLGEVTANYNNRKYVLGPRSTRHMNPNMSEYTSTSHKGVKDAQGDLVPASTMRVTF